MEPTPADRSRPAGDGFDLGAMLVTESDYVWKTLRRLGVRGSDLEDLAHDVFVAAFRSADRYDRTRPLRPWLFGVAFRIVSHHRRRERRAPLLVEDTDDRAAEAPGADQQASDAQDRTVLLAALAALDIDRRAVFVMHEIDGCSAPDIAAALEIPLNTAYSRLRLAREDFTAAVRRVRLQRGEP